MMVTLVYLSGKLSQATGQVLFSVLRSNYPRWFPYTGLISVVIRNTIEADADIDGIAGAIGVLVHMPKGACARRHGANLYKFWILCPLTNLFVSLRCRYLRSIPGISEACRSRAWHIAAFPLGKDALSILVAIIGTSLWATSTRDKEEAGRRQAMNILGWIRTIVIFSASTGLVISWFVN